MGSKARHAKHIVPILMQGHTKDMWYVEPFVGGCNMMDSIDPNIAPKRLGSDSNPYLIALWKSVSQGWLPPEIITEDEYNNIRKNKEQYDPALVGYVGFALSYAGKWFGGWCRDREGKRDYVGEAYRNALRQFPLLSGVRFINKSVFDLDFENAGRCTIYCDPPYAGTTRYKDDFDHAKFYDWCYDRYNEGHRVFISEYWMPTDRFKCVWSRDVVNSLTKDTGSKKGIERLFIVGREVNGYFTYC